MMTREVTGLFGGSRCVVRLRTNLEVYWDQIFVAPLIEEVEGSGSRASSRTVRVTCLDVASASLAPRPCMKEFSPDGRQPTLYDYDLLEPVPAARLSGYATRYGNVTELLRESDDRFVIFGAGDEVTARFDAHSLPPLPPGWRRSFVLRTWGYCKDSTPFSDVGETIEPLPFAAMRTYPYGGDQCYSRDRLHEGYRRRFNTRWVGPERAPASGK
jgi:hypothetical protein